MKKYLIILLFVCGLIISPVFTFAVDMESQCAVISESTNGCPNLSSADCKILLQQCADYYDDQSALLAQDITKTSQQKNALANQISSLKNKISSLQTQINQSNLMVKDLNGQITDTRESIDKTSDQIVDTQGQIATILRSIYEEDQKPSFIILLEGDLSDFFSNLAYLESLNSSVSKLLESTQI